jgi:hypothetical protein
MLGRAQTAARRTVPRQRPLLAVYRQQAAANAARRSGHQEVISTLTRARALLTQWPDTLERAHQELALLTALGPTLMATRGVAAPEVEQTYVRLQALSHHVEESPRGL